MESDILNHLAIIMDGNGRWAQKKGRPRAYGHIKGTRVAKEIIRACAKRGIAHLTLYAFSSENWLRPPAEVQFLMRLLGRYLEKERANLVKENIRVDVIGELERVPAAVKKEIDLTIEQTQHNTGLHLVFALSYGSRQEITMAAKKLAHMVARGELSPDQINEDLFARSLETSTTPDPDCVLRTSGEQRISNFLLWQAAYSEFYFTDTLWPDFTVAELDRALENYAHRNRRFGQLEDPRALNLGDLA